MPDQKPPQKQPAQKPAKSPARQHEREDSQQAGKPTVGPDTHDENVGQRQSQDEPYVIKPLHDETE